MYLVDNTLDEGIRYGLHRTNMEFEGSMKDIKHKAKEFINKYNEIKEDACEILLCNDESRKLTKEILESHAYTTILEYYLIKNVVQK